MSNGPFCVVPNSYLQYELPFRSPVKGAVTLIQVGAGAVAVTLPAIVRRGDGGGASGVRMVASRAFSSVVTGFCAIGVIQSRADCIVLKDRNICSYR